MKVVILAGGFGTRISEESHLKPKPMIEIGEKPILWHIMKEYSAYGINEFIICAGYKQHVIKEWFADYFIHTSDITFDFTKGNEMIIHNKHAEPWKVTVVDTGLNTQTGGRIKRVKDFVGDDTFMVSMYQPIASDDKKKICALMRLYKFYYRTIGCVIAFLGLLLLPFIPHLVKSDLPDNLNIYVLYLLNLGATVLTYWLFAYKNAILDAYQRTDITSKIMLVTSTIQYFLQILILVFLKNYYVYLIVVLVTQIANNLITAAIVQYKYPNYVAMGELEKDEVKQINCRIRDLFTSKLGGVIVNSADTVVISAFLGLTKLAIYQNYYFIITSVIGVVGIVFSSCTAGIGNSMVTETIEKNYKDFKKFTFLVMAIVNFCTSCFLCLFQPFMEVWVGNELMLSFGMVVLFCIYFIDYECMALLSVYKDACGIWHHDRFRPLCEAGINLLLNLLLVNIGGLYGILLSTIISMSFVSLPWLVMNLFNFVFRRSSSEYISILIQNVIVVIVDMIVCYAICQMVHLGGIMTIIFRGAVCVVFSNISYFAIWKNNEDFKDAIKLLNSIFKGKR